VHPPRLANWAAPARTLHQARDCSLSRSSSDTLARRSRCAERRRAGAQTAGIARPIDRVVSPQHDDCSMPHTIAAAAYFIISSGGMMPTNSRPPGSLGHTFGFWAVACHGRGSKYPSSSLT